MGAHVQALRMGRLARGWEAVRIGEEIVRLARRHPRVEEAVVTAGGRGYRSVGSELVLTIDREALVPHGVNVDQVIQQVRTLVRGNTVRARHIGKDIMAGLRNIVGGRGAVLRTAGHGRGRMAAPC